MQGIIFYLFSQYNDGLLYARVKACQKCSHDAHCHDRTNGSRRNNMQAAGLVWPVSWQVNGKLHESDSHSARTRAKAKAQPEKWDMWPVPTKILAVLIDAMLEDHEGVHLNAAYTCVSRECPRI